ncbi:MAG: glycosyl hydrolase, partial [Planctomycetota bacterium]
MDLAESFRDPPPEARLRCYWWWLNSHVTAEAITRDLEEMKDKGLGGAMIFDAGGATHRGNKPVPAGPTFLSDPWRALFRHAVQEADRLGLVLSLNIQSGWNLGGPSVTPKEAAKKAVWAFDRVRGPAEIERSLPTPKHRGGLYRDAAVLAWPVPKRPGAEAEETLAAVRASSAQKGHPPQRAAGGDTQTFWVSEGFQPGDGPTGEAPEWLELALKRPVAVTGLVLQGRPGYGPRQAALQVADGGERWRTVRSFTVPKSGQLRVEFDETRGRRFRILITDAWDPRAPEAPRNVQITELRLTGEKRAWPAGVPKARPIRLLPIKIAAREFGGAAPDCSPLLDYGHALPGEEDLRHGDVVLLTDRLDADGVVRWEVPEGQWQIMRLGYTLSGAHVSTHSRGWGGLVLDYLDPAALQAYWQRVVQPLLEDAGPLAGRTLRYLHTDSWELGGANWTPRLLEEFRARRGYDPTPYLPVLAGKIVDSRPVSNRFLYDFRRTIGDGIVENHYRQLARRAHRHGLGIHPESGGPHGAPIDSLKCLGVSDIPMSEFWARSDRHRVRPEDRFFVKQPASVAHTYGRRIAAAEAFTTIGPHWEAALQDNLKPTFDQALCEGLNLAFWHTFTCSPRAMGVPGQEYFAGTHLNPQVTWWPRAGAFVDYINRCQFLLQQGLFVADVCAYYGAGVPNFAQLKKSDPAGVLPGYDYDVATAEVLRERMSVKDGRLLLPDGMSYRLLVLPDQTAMPLSVLDALARLVRDGATVLGPKPTHTPGLRGYPECDAKLKRLADALWGQVDGRKVTERRVGRGRIVWGRSARQVLAADGVPPDFAYQAERDDAFLDYVHRRVGGAEIYFVANRLGRWEQARCSFRTTGRAPELWDPVSGTTRPAAAFHQADGRTTLPLELAPYGSLFVVFRSPTDARSGPGTRNSPVLRDPHELAGPWTVRFDPERGGPKQATFQRLVSWSQRPEDGIRHYAGAAVYHTAFD